MTGEVTLRGRVLAIGGLKEKAVAANRAGIRTVLIPKDNERDIEDIPDTVREALKIIPVAHMDEVLDHALVRIEAPHSPCQCDETEKGESEKEVNGS